MFLASLTIYIVTYINALCMYSILQLYLYSYAYNTYSPKRARNGVKKMKKYTIIQDTVVMGYGDTPEAAVKDANYYLAPTDKIKKKFTESDVSAFPVNETDVFLVETGAEWFVKNIGLEN